MRTIILALVMAPAALPAQTGAPTAAPVATPIATVATADATATDQPKQICRSTLETGSLVKRKKECHTSAEWKVVLRARADEARAAIDRQASGARSGQ